jgi:hypothetical protein
MTSLPTLTSDATFERRRYNVLVLTEGMAGGDVGDWLEQQLPDGGLMVEQDLHAWRGKSCLSRLAVRLASAVRCSGRILLLRNAHTLSRRKLSRLEAFVRTGRLKANWAVITMAAPNGPSHHRRVRKLEKLFQPDCVVMIRAEAGT